MTMIIDPNDAAEVQLASLKMALENIDDHFKQVNGPIINYGGPVNYQITQMLRQGEKLRESIWKLPILPGALKVFNELAASREWTVTGKPQQVSRAVEGLQRTVTIDLYNGNRYVGFEDFIKRVGLDYNVVGRIAFKMPEKKSGGIEPMQYLDPTRLRWMRDKTRGDNYSNPVRDNEKVWQYDRQNDRKFAWNQVVIYHPIPVASSLFVAPITPILPSASLAWLLQEHNTASVDGRKIKEIMMVSGINIRETLQAAIDLLVASYAGAQMEGTSGIPVVEVNNPHGVPLKDLVTTLGISKVPETFDENEFTVMYVNIIAATLGISLRQFWNDERSTNKALEVVQEQRQQQKGPTAFIRSMQRLLNAPDGPMSLYSSARSKTRFAFLEEVDASSRARNAEVLERTANALEKIQVVFNAQIDPQSFLAWMQSIDMLPNELELMDVSPEAVRRNPDDAAFPSDGEQIQDGDPEPVPLETQKSNPYAIDYDEVTVDSSGRVLDRRVKVFTVEKLLADGMARAAEIIELKSDDPFLEAVDQVSALNEEILKKRYQDVAGDIDEWVVEQSLWTESEARSVIEKCIAGETLDRSEQRVINILVADVLN